MKWSKEADMALLEEIQHAEAHVMVYGQLQKRFDQVSSRLALIPPPKGPIKASWRPCKERFEFLVDTTYKEMAAGAKKTGNAQQFGEFEKLLETLAEPWLDYWVI
jgi:hypothetical protein